MDPLISGAIFGAVLKGVVWTLQAPTAAERQISDWARRCPKIEDLKVGATAREWLNALTPDNHGDDSIDVDALALLSVTLAVSTLTDSSANGRTLTPKQLSDTWYLIYNALVILKPSNLNFKVAREAPGFLSVPLYCKLYATGLIDQMVCINVWLPFHNMDAMDGFTIHAHETFVQTWVLAGAVEKRAYDYSVVTSSDPVSSRTRRSVEANTSPTTATHAGFSPSWIGGYSGSASFHQSSSPESVAKRTEARYELHGMMRREYARDSSFTVPVSELHELSVFEDQLPATICHFDSRRGETHRESLILGPIEELESPYSRDAGIYTASALVELINAQRDLEQRNVQVAFLNEYQMKMAYYHVISGRLNMRQASDPQQSESVKESARLEAYYCFHEEPNPPLLTLAKERHPLHTAYVKELLGYGVDVNAEDEDGYDALYYANFYSNFEVKELLEQNKENMPS